MMTDEQFAAQLDSARASVQMWVGDELIGVGWEGEDGTCYLGAPRTGGIAEIKGDIGNVEGLLRMYRRHFEKTGVHGI